MLKKQKDYLLSHKKVSNVIYPSAKEGVFLERANTYLPAGKGSLLGFELKGGKDSGKKFIDFPLIYFTMLPILGTLEA